MRGGAHYRARNHEVFLQYRAIALYLQKYIVYRKRKIFFADGKFDTFMELILKHKEEKFLVSLTEPNNGEVPDTMEKLKLNLSKVVLAKTWQPTSRG